MSAVDTIGILGSEDRFASEKCSNDTNVYIVNRLFAKSGKSSGPYQLHYKTHGIWIKCEHKSPLKKYSNMELEFRPPNKPLDLWDIQERVEYDMDGMEIENTGYLDELNIQKQEATIIRNLYIAAKKISQMKAKEVRMTRRGIKLTEEEVDELLNGEDFY
ncbi:hypothetical protein H4R99_000824 [Coemansia sp. RSA 1722]|nr:hypothetical protein IWW45_003627 [Coemansia sp. RSA 485]KAJ2599302.1 hypothetical protein GGF39_002282 [Coemansia sp. RSA 1721]KAJ2605820.1 hypothetical protein H4R99_000824 [Coemansia sp. RSA 1722]KAJ2638888.1 hypothetical protein GGF40_001291 [Coemansia sp. RSA 1286]KAJ2702221.1 hypothetical protein FB645_004357 [Coemansia sp. IMI 203386]